MNEDSENSISSAEDSNLKIRAQECLKKHFGFDSFRSSQYEVIREILNGQNTLAIMPTGKGKSLCYQLPALMLDGVTCVVSPLIALMKDQVDALKARGISAACINSAQSWGEQLEILDSLKNGELKIVYVAPERFRAQSFLNALNGIKLSLFAIDEAHCISQWGHDFRPDYMRLGKAIELLGKPRIAAFTATATPDVKKDILTQLKIPEAKIFVSGFARENLSFNIVSVSSKTEKEEAIKHLINDFKTGIIYCSTRKSAEQVSEFLTANKFNHILYHGGMTPTERDIAQEEFMKKNCDIAVATNAFGMGIDRSDIRFICHYELTGSIEAFYQEAGRAGRDGLDAHCEMLFMYSDKRVQEFFIEGANPDVDTISKTYEVLHRQANEAGEVLLKIEDIATLMKDKVSSKKPINTMAVSSAISILRGCGYIDRYDVSSSRIRGTRICDMSLLPHLLNLPKDILEEKRARDLSKLQSVLSFAYSKSCRQEWILDYFGESNLSACGKCDKCIAGTNSTTRELNADELDIVRKALSAIARMSYRIDKFTFTPRFGRERILKCLVGKKDEKTLAANLDQLSTYGILKSHGKVFVGKVLDAMKDARLIDSFEGEYRLLGITSKGVEVMFGLRNVLMDFPEFSKKGLRKMSKEKKLYETDDLPDDEILYKKLVSKRNQLQHLRGKVPAYVIFPNNVLKQLADMKPKTVDDAMTIKGIGPQKASTILPSFLKIIAQHESVS